MKLMLLIAMLTGTVYADSRLEVRGNKELKMYILENVEAIENQMNRLDLAQDAKIFPQSVSCLGVLAKDSGDVSLPGNGVFGTCLARVELGWPDSDDTILQVSISAAKELSVQILAQQL